MFTRTERPTETPEAEDMDLATAMCPPHSFDQGWGLAPGDELVVHQFDSGSPLAVAE